MIPTEAGRFYVQHVAGRPVILWQRAGVTYSMVGDIDRQALLRVAGSVKYLQNTDVLQNIVMPARPVRTTVGGL